ncbi:hypothetical protein [Pyrobaculum aerophilum]|uniref:Uncharacterized protein n=1 Tax=Pyrobaculum aerophilum TaxID=13773 RepID=A0A371R6M3_9CREN|nr:hypothetical protein [Pyrobaculum aerophilum]RFA97290.1 hypothetical protein CGL51_03560 [Pyrobaculum aerophilum]RFB00143.1 hypothetical protein CGL52_02050 [Pyrobaculum aerophilum]
MDVCLPEPPYRFSDPSEVVEAYRLAVALYYPSSYTCFRVFNSVLYKFAAEGRDISRLFYQLRHILNAWKRLCKPQCYKNGFCRWSLCSVKLDQLIKAVEEDGAAVDLDFVVAVYEKGRSAWCAFTTRHLEILEEVMRCRFPSLELVYQGDVYIHLTTRDLLERRARSIEGASEDLCYRLDAPSGVVPRVTEEGAEVFIEVFTKLWKEAIFLWLAFDGIFELHYDGKWCGYKVTFRGDAAKRFAKAMLNLCAYLQAYTPPRPSEEEYQEALRQLGEAREECEAQLRIEPCNKAWNIAMELELVAHIRPKEKTAELERRLKEAEEECERSGGSLEPCRRKLKLSQKVTVMEAYMRQWEDTTVHCQLAKSMAHLAEGVEPPLISEHLRQYWRIAAAQEGHVLYFVRPIIEALETGYVLRWPLIRPYKRE